MEHKYSLSIDCSQNIQILLLDKDFKVIEQTISEELPSRALHTAIEELITNNKLSINHIANYFCCLGPGSYTALRMIKGFKELLEVEGKNVVGYTYLDVLDLLQLDNVFVEYAFKDEYFVYDRVHGTRLIKNVVSEDGNVNIAQVKKMIIKESATFFKKVAEAKRSKDVLYFRSLKEEYKK